MVCAIPIIIINHKKRSRDKQFVQMLFNLAGQYNCKITEYDHWGNKAIGIDKQRLQLFFICKKEASGLTEKQVDLDTIKKCRFINTSRTVNTGGGSQTVIEKLELGFTWNDPKIPEDYMEFYNSIYDSLSLRGEIQLAEKWSAIANKEIGLKVS
jgi:hypothetical protein